MTVWWATAVEARSAFARDVRNGFISSGEHKRAILRLDKIRSQWEEIEPDGALRILAEDLPDRFALRAADALQLAAAYTWTMHRPAGRPFISGDKRLLQAAEELGFRTIAV
jgi:predicted nucleic acid-binding protein